MAVSYKDYYKLLGVDKTAKPEQISKSFKKAGQKIPSRPEPPATKRPKRNSKEINEAYEVLKRPRKSANFMISWAGLGEVPAGREAPAHRAARTSISTVRTWAAATFPTFLKRFSAIAAVVLAAMLSEVFGARQQGPRRGRDVEAELHSHPVGNCCRRQAQEVTLQMPEGRKSWKSTCPQASRTARSSGFPGQGDPSPNGGQPGDLSLIIRYLPDKAVQGGRGQPAIRILD